jgi:hypothetical protein
MAIAPRKNKHTADTFIAGAPDAAHLHVQPEPPATNKVKRLVGKKNILSVPMSPEMVNRLDAWASSRGMSRAAALALATHKLLES